MLKHALTFCALLFLFVFCHSQVVDEACFEKCSRSHSLQRPTQVNYFQYPQMSQYDVHYLKLDLEVEPGIHYIKGSALIGALTTQLMDTFVCEFNDFIVIDSVFVNGIKTTTFIRENDHILVKLNPSILEGKKFTVQFYYQGEPSFGGVFTGTQPTTGLRYIGTVSESYQARDWFPAKQILKDKIDSTDIWITTPNINPSGGTNLAGSNGKLEQVIDLPGGKKQFRWKTRYPMAYYLASIAVANYQEYKNYAKPIAMAPDSILVQHYIVINPAYLAANKVNLDKTPVFIEQLSVFYGLYPFYQEKYGHAQIPIGGGMEHQTMSTMNSFGTTLIAHELAHQWFGDNVTCATWNHIWLNEGFASYSEYLLMEALPALFPGLTPPAYMLDIHNNVMSLPGGSVFVPNSSIYDEGRIFNFRLSYNKGSAIIHNLRFEMQSDNQFIQLMRSFQQQFKDTVATAEDFRTLAQTISGKDFSDFFTQWYYGEGYPTFNIDYSRQGDSLVLFVSQTTSAPAITPLFKGLYEIKISTLQGDTLVKVNMTANTQTFKFRSNRTPTGVVFDPNNWVINKVGSITTSINNPSSGNVDVTVYPNPSTGTIYLKYPALTYDQLQLYDFTGRLLHQQTIKGTTQTTVNIPLPAGIYLIHLKGKNKTAILKQVIIR